MKINIFLFYIVFVSLSNYVCSMDDDATISPNKVNHFFSEKVKKHHDTIGFKYEYSESTWSLNSKNKKSLDAVPQVLSSQIELQVQCSGIKKEHTFKSSTVKKIKGSKLKVGFIPDNVVTQCEDPFCQFIKKSK